MVADRDVDEAGRLAGLRHLHELGGPGVGSQACTKIVLCDCTGSCMPKATCWVTAPPPVGETRTCSSVVLQTPHGGPPGPLSRRPPTASATSSAASLPGGRRPPRCCCGRTSLGLVLLLGTAVVVTGDASARDVLIGAVGGPRRCRRASGLLYQALSIGPMSAVAPITALLVRGRAGGRRASPRVSAPSSPPSWAWRRPSPRSCSCRPRAAAACGRPTSAASTLALGAGLGFGLFFVALSYTGDDSGVWPLVGARAMSVAVVGRAGPPRARPAARAPGRRPPPHRRRRRPRRRCQRALPARRPPGAAQRRVRARLALPGQHRRARAGSCCASASLRCSSVGLLLAIPAAVLMST